MVPQIPQIPQIPQDRKGACPDWETVGQTEREGPTLHAKSGALMPCFMDSSCQGETVWVRARSGFHVSFGVILYDFIEKVSCMIF